MLLIYLSSSDVEDLLFSYKSNKKGFWYQVYPSGKFTKIKVPKDYLSAIRGFFEDNGIGVRDS